METVGDRDLHGLTRIDGNGAGTDTAGLVLPQMATSLAQTRASRDAVLARIEKLVQARPLFGLLTSMPAVDVRTAARILTEVVGKDFESAGNPASCAGLAPVTWRSGTSVPGDHSSRRRFNVLYAHVMVPTSTHPSWPLLPEPFCSEVPGQSGRQFLDESFLSLTVTEDS